MQAPTPPQPVRPNTNSSQPTLNITTEQIQKYLDENMRLIVAIMENQNLGKFAECVMLQAQLQENLMFLAQVADAQAQLTAPQKLPESSQQGEHPVHPPQAAVRPPQAAMSPQTPYQPPKFNLQQNDQSQLQWQYQ